jgi:hypothetical protein
MARDKSKDDKFFSCSQEHEVNYVAGLYPSHVQTVYNFIKNKCASNAIKYSTHLQVYQLIYKELGYPVPV